MSEVLRDLILESMMDTAMDIAQIAHMDQVRRGSRIPYITHPIRVRGIAERFGYPRIVQVAAVVHDAIEDAQDPEEITRLIGSKIPLVLPIVQAVTHERGVSYLDYIRGISGFALQVKLSDMLHNLLDEPSERQRLKYRRALRAIQDERNGTPREINPDHWSELFSLVGLESIEEVLLRKFITGAISFL